MKKKLLSLCPIADEAAKKRMAEFYDITELEKCTEEELFARAGSFEALIVPYTAAMLVTERVIDKAANLEIIASSYGGTAGDVFGNGQLHGQLDHHGAGMYRGTGPDAAVPFQQG